MFDMLLLLVSHLSIARAKLSMVFDIHCISDEAMTVQQQPCSRFAHAARH